MFLKLKQIPLRLMFKMKKFFDWNTEQDNSITTLQEENKKLKATLCDMGRLEWC